MSLRNCLLLVPFFLLSAVGYSQVNFKPHRWFSPVVAANKIAAADFNGDGVVDIVAAGEYATSVLLSSSSGPPLLKNYDSPPFSGVIATGDWDGDGDIDLALYGINSLSFLVNSGSGIFTRSPVHHPVVDGYTGSAAADFNNDGKDDLAFGQLLKQTILVFLHPLDSLEKPVEFSVSPGSMTEVSDINKDGKKDIVVADADNQVLRILIGKGDGSFQSEQTFPVPVRPATTVVVDFNGDGQLDIGVSGITDNNIATLVVLTGNGGSFSVANTYLLNVEFVYPGSLAAADLDGNSSPDIVYLDWVNGKLEGKMLVMSNAGDGTFGNPQSTFIGGQPYQVVTGDFNADGKNDLAVTNYTAIQTIYNEGNGSFNVVSSGSGMGYTIALADFNNDQNWDAAVTDGSTLSILLGDAQARFPTQARIPLGTGFFISIRVGDVTGDLKTDIILCNPEDGNISVLTGIGDGTFEAPQKIASGKPWDIELADLNGDDRTDIVAVDQVNGSVLFVQSTPSGFLDPVTIASIGLPTDVATGDLTGDGLPDLIVTSGNTAFLIVNSGAGGFAAPMSLNDVIYETPIHFDIRDFTGDGIPDIGFNDRQYFNILRNDGQAHFTFVSKYFLGSEAHNLCVGDFNGDERQDIAVSSGGSSSFTVLLGTSAGGFDGPYYFPYSVFPSGIAVADLDHDSKDDIALVGGPYALMQTYISLPRMDITVYDTVRLYGHPEPDFRSTVTGWPGPGAPTITYTTPAWIRSPVGTYSVEPIVPDSVRMNYAVVGHPGQLTIKPAPVTIVANDARRKVHELDPTFSGTITGLLNDDYVPYYFYTSAELNSGPGYYPIYPGVTRFPNYEFTMVPGTLTVLAPYGEPKLEPFPNPAAGYFYIDSRETRPFGIYDVTGKSVISGTLTPGRNRIELKLPGMYTIRSDDGYLARVVIY